MKAMKGLHLLMVLIVLLGTAAVFVLDAPAQNLHVLMVIDNGNPKTAARHSVDKQRIEGLINTEVGPVLKKVNSSTEVKVDELLSNDGQATRDNILSWLRNLNLGADDMVFLYYSGHGAADKTGAKERFLLLQGGKTYRKEIAKAVEELNCRLKILITEVCSTGPVNRPAVITTADQESIIRNLFLEHEGFLNVTSTTLGHKAMGDNVEGGWFTMALMDGFVPAHRDDVDRDPQDGFVSWEEVIEVAKESLARIYKTNVNNFPPSIKRKLDAINQTTQVPEVLSFPKRIP